MIKIFIIEDDPAILLGLEELFKSEHYEVISYSDGREGLSMALNIRPALVILDINLPNLNGLDICRKLRENGFINPIIMLTARSEQLDKIVGLEIGADDYLTKPFNSRELLARARAQLRRFNDIDTAQKNNHYSKDYRRKLLTIMFTDMKDYSKKMNLNEEIALNVLKHHNEIVRSVVVEFEGKIVESSGDGFLVSFESVISAVKCAHLLQCKLKNHNENKPEDGKIEIRIGMHLGDVIEFEGKLKGDTLNIAARIQQNTPPGSIYISGNVFDAVKNKVEFVIENKGIKTFKNIKDPLTIYSIAI